MVGVVGWWGGGGGGVGGEVRVRARVSGESKPPPFCTLRSQPHPFS